MQPRHTSRAAAAAIVLAVFGLLMAGLVSPASAASTGTVKGVVTLEGVPVENAKVQVYRLVLDKSNDEFEVGSRLKTDNTDSLGRYSVSGLTAKTAASSRYIVLVTDRTGKTVRTYRTIVAKKGKTLTQNIHLKAAVILRGTVNTSDGRSPAGLTVGVDPLLQNMQGASYDQLYPESSATVKADGSFKLAGLPAGNYDAVMVADGPHAQQCYDFVAGSLVDCGTDRAAYERQHIQLTSGEQRTLPTVTASKFAPPTTKVSGKVTDTSGKALKGITVRIAALDGGATETVVTRSSGRFALDESIPAGAYTVRFDDPKHVWASQYLGGGPDKSVRRQITVTPGQPVSGLNTALKSNATARFATKGGSGTAKVAVKITRKASGSATSGKLTLSFGDVTKTVLVTKGKATVTLTGLPKGTQSLVAEYSGTSTTAWFSKIVKVAVK